MIWYNPGLIISFDFKLLVAWTETKGGSSNPSSLPKDTRVTDWPDAEYD